MRDRGAGGGTCPLKPSGVVSNPSTQIYTLPSNSGVFRGMALQIVSRITFEIRENKCTQTCNNIGFKCPTMLYFVAFTCSLLLQHRPLASIDNARIAVSNAIRVASPIGRTHSRAFRNYEITHVPLLIRSPAGRLPLALAGSGSCSLFACQRRRQGLSGQPLKSSIRGSPVHPASPVNNTVEIPLEVRREFIHIAQDLHRY